MLGEAHSLTKQTREAIAYAVDMHVRLSQMKVWLAIVAPIGD